MGTSTQKPSVALDLGSRVRWLGLAWALVAMGDALRFGAFSSTAIMVEVAASVVVTTTLLTAAQPRFGRQAFAIVIGITALIVPFYPLHNGGADGMSVAIVLATVVALAVMVTGLVGDHRDSGGRWRFLCIVGLAAGVGVMTILASPRPGNDVWFMYQASSGAILHGHNIFLTHWTSGLPGEDSNGFGYLPGSAVVQAPFYALFGDVRYGLLAASLLAAWCAYELGGRRAGWLCGAFILLFPKANYGVAMSWTDPLLLAGMAAMVLAVRRHRLGWAVVAFAVVLCCKQDAWLFLPLAAWWKDFGWKRALASATAALAICLPWAVAAPRPFWHGVLFLDWDLPPRADSLSLFSIALRLGVDPGYLLIAGLTGVALVAGLLLLPRNAYGFLGGCALVMTWFNLASKQSYFNEWELAAGLIVLCMASVAGTSDVELLPRPRWRRRPRPMVVAPG